MADPTDSSADPRSQPNPPTLVASAIVELREPLSFEVAFKRHYAEVRRTCLGCPHLGVALMAIDPDGRLAGSLSIVADAASPRTAIVGRHDHCDLILDRDPSVSLRHLAVILPPVSEADDLRLRLIDLRSSTGIVDEHGRRHASLEADGPLLLELAGYTLLVLPTGLDHPWPEDADEAWDTLPRPVVVEHPADASRSPAIEPMVRRRRSSRRSSSTRPRTRGGETTLVTRPGPLAHNHTQDMLSSGEDIVGVVRVSTPDRAQDFAVGQRALERGILVGRYERCDTDNILARPDGRISRVHLLIIEVDGELTAIDTASTNGTMVVGGIQRVRTTGLSAERVLVLAGHEARLRWLPTQ